MKKIILFLLVHLFFVGCKSQENENYKVLSYDNFKSEISQSNVIVLDVRTADEYQEGHVSGAINIDVQSDDFDQKVQLLNKENPVYIYCRSGKRSQKAGAILQNLGFTKIYDLEGGILSWQGELEK
jgi:rhodanese-related sulfurtransferase